MHNINENDVLNPQLLLASRTFNFDNYEWTRRETRKFTCFEPETPCLQGRCSTELSYEPISMKMYEQNKRLGVKLWK